MIRKLFTVFLFLSVFCLNAQPLILMDRFNGNKVVNDSTIAVFSNDVNINEITQYFTMKNNTDRPLAVFLRKTVNFYADSTTDYYCFGIRCWPGDDSTDVADTIPVGGEDYTFASHVVHKRRFDIPQPPLPPGLSSITYTVFDKTTFPTPVEASVTVIYHQSGLGIGEEETGRQGDKGTGRGEAVVYPNPAWDKITIETGITKPGEYALILYNNLGTEMRKASIQLQESNLTITVNHLLPGIYYGKLVSEQGASVAFRFQVAR
jgi:hypothetical protein